MLSEKLDDIDRRIIEILRRGVRTPFKNIGRELGISDTIVHVRVRRKVDEAGLDEMRALIFKIREIPNVVASELTPVFKIWKDA